jgi:two-component system CheB/CheR fusion protein
MSTKKKATSTRSRGSDGDDRTVDALLDRIRNVRNFDFRNYKRGTLKRRIDRRMAERRCRSVGDYLTLLDREPGEVDALIASMLIKMTSFFRDSETWDALGSRVIPQILQQRRGNEEIRVWCAGCATGEEAFSMAILLAEAMGPSFHTQELKVFGTDLDEHAVAYARRGVYTRQQVEGVPKEILARWFVEEPMGWSVRKEIRRKVVFGVNNLVSDAPISRIDLLSCRNVFIYLDANLQKRVLTRFHYALKRNGVLVLGKSELIPFAAKLFEPIDLPRRIYRKDGRRDANVAQERLLGLLEQESAARSPGQPSGEDLSVVDQFYRDVVHSLKVSLVATGLDGTVTLWNSGAAALWGRAEGETLGRKLTALNLPGLPGDLLVEKTAAVREGRATSETAEGTLTRDGDKHQILVSTEVTALRDGNGERTGLLYHVEHVSPLRELQTEVLRVNEERRAAFEELQTTNEELQSSNEELETTNEELQSANEELQTTNEELQSTNEELETTNEELQSTNAELDAINRELAHRTDEMNLLSFFQRAIIRSLSAAVIVLDPAGKVTLWNLAAERLLGLTESEALGQVLWTLHIPALARPSLQKVKKALNQGLAHRNEEVEYQLPTGAHGRGTLAAVPLNDDGHALGSVVIFEDSTRASMLQAQVAELQQKLGNAKLGNGEKQPVKKLR